VNQFPLYALRFSSGDLVREARPPRLPQDPHYPRLFTRARYAEVAKVYLAKQGKETTIVTFSLVEVP
jgi:hypothetical protein